MDYPKTIKDLIACFKKLPGVGEKTAERYALTILNSDKEFNDLFAETVKNIKTKVKRCSICNNYAEEDICAICKDKSRVKNLICVVEEPKNIILFEKIGTYNGSYHVLDGLISPLDGINPEDIKIESLIKRINDNEVKEVIIAVKPSIEGETTALYISKLLENKNVKITKIAHGVPIGADMDYIDALTLELALENRTEIS